jgi:endonuclease/exonuclease/phosphatase family metal-dependent hydrolase
MFKLLKILIITITLLFISACEKPNIPPESPADIEVTKFGMESRFEIATWNIENFPLKDEQTIAALKTVIEKIDVDFIAVQEIASVSDFNSLLNMLPGWSGGYSSDVYSSGNYQKTGYLYKTAMISVSDVHNIFENDSYVFPRPPLMLYVSIKDRSGTPFDFNLIVMHLKAMGGEANETRRRAAIDTLKYFIDSEIAAGADADFIVLGDWNDHLSDDRVHNVFQKMLDDSLNYQFLTQSLQDQYTYISTRYPKSLIDHILITSDVKTEYGKGLTKVLYLDDEYEDYKEFISDHRPVVVKFNGFYVDMP